MKIRISILGVLLTLYSTIMFMPGYFSGSFLNLLDNAFLMAALGYLFINKYRPSKFIVFVAIYFSFVITMSFINKTAIADIHLIISNIKIVVFMALVEFALSKRETFAVNNLFYVLFMFVTLDSLSIVIFPDGLYQSSIVWNEWSTSYNAQWIYGNKNSHVCWFSMLILLSYWRYINSYKLKDKLILFSVLAMSIVAMLIIQSMTSVAVIAIIILGVCLSMMKNFVQRINMNIYFIYIIYAILLIFVLSGFTSFLQPIVTEFMGKDMSFSNRIYIWAQVLVLFLQKPLFGWGMVSVDESADILGSAAFTNAHNQILNTLWQGGIIGLLLVIAMLFIIAKKINLNKNKGIKVFLGLMIFAILIEMMFESILSARATWIWLLLCYHFTEFDNDNISYMTVKNRNGVNCE